MTIADGIPCLDGIVICADTQHTQGESKYDKPKIWPYERDLVVTGSGLSDYMKMAFDKLSASYQLLRPDKSENARDAVEALMRNIYEVHIFPFHNSGHPEATDINLSLIVGIRCANGELALIKTAHTGALLCNKAEAIGIGASIFNYWASYFLHGKMPMEVVGYLCIFMLREVKNAGYACGGSTEIYKLPRDATKLKNRNSIWSEQDVLAGFPTTTADLLLACADLNMQDSEFESRILDYIHRFRNLRQTLLQNLERSQQEILLRTATTGPTIQIPTGPEI